MVANDLTVNTVSLGQTELTWGSLKSIVESLGVKDTDNIQAIDIFSSADKLVLYVTSSEESPSYGIASVVN